MFYDKPRNKSNVWNKKELFIKEDTVAQETIEQLTKLTGSIWSGLPTKQIKEQVKLLPEFKINFFDDLELPVCKVSGTRLLCFQWHNDDLIYYFDRLIQAFAAYVGGSYVTMLKAISGIEGSFSGSTDPDVPKTHYDRDSFSYDLVSKAFRHLLTVALWHLAATKRKSEDTSEDLVKYCLPALAEIISKTSNNLPNKERNPHVSNNR